MRAACQAGDLRRAEALVTPAMFRLAITGTVDEIVERVTWLRERGVTQVSVGPPLGLDKELALRITAERVIARFQ